MPSKKGFELVSAQCKFLIRLLKTLLLLAQTFETDRILHSHGGLIREELEYLEVVLIVIVLLESRTQHDPSIQPLFEF